MSNSLIFVSAFNDSGGGYLARLLDGHPDLAVFPFELQLGTGLAPAGFDEWFAAKYRWPHLPPDARDAFDAFANEELRAAMRGAPKFSGFNLDLDRQGWREAFEHEVEGSADIGQVASSWLRTFFESWRDGPAAANRRMAGHCPVLALDWELLVADLPDARMLHVVRSPFASFADTARRRPGTSPEGFAVRWSLVNTVAALHAARTPDQFRIVHYGALIGNPAEAMAEIAQWLGLDFDETLLTPTWNGTPLARMGPFGGIPLTSEDYEESQIERLTARERETLSTETSAARVLCMIDDVRADAGARARENFVEPAANLTVSGIIATKDIPMPLEYETSGDFWGLLNDLGVALLVTREYEHLLLLIGGNEGRPWQSVMPIPHPSGAFVRPRDGALVVSSTRTPNQLLWFQPLLPEAWHREIVAPGVTPDDGTLYLPSVSRVLPGTLYIHDVVMADDELYVTATGHNFVARIDFESGWERVWWPAVLDGLGTEAFASNRLQLNSIGLGASGLSDAYFTAFSDETSGPKPWHEGYGPKGRGVVFSAQSREVVLRHLTCPHSATRHNKALWLCNSGEGAVGVVENVDQGVDSSAFSTVVRLPGFTRGLTFVGGHAIVGLSKVIERYEPYAPGVSPSSSRCGLAIVDIASGDVAAQLWWPNGLQIYEVQTLPGVTRPRLPSTHAGTGRPHLGFLA